MTSRPLTDNEQLAALSVAWMQAWKDGNRSAIEQILAQDFTLVVSSSVERPVTRSQWLELAFNGYVCESFRYTRQHVRLLGEYAVVSSVAEQRASIKGKDRSGEFFLTDIWRKHAGQWQVVARHSSKPEAASPGASAVAPGSQAPA